ncbi:MAG: hypothetical protein DME08_28610 [Candidatus Rokuibacteriota bacterium]|nr:MAG: hypothetical protein DME08_28610 [Candidatus Rokubacteria bacterium]
MMTRNAPNLRNIHVLVVDEHQDTLEVFRTALESCMANVLTARTARDAVTILKTVRLDAIISDLAMPGEDGLGVVDQLRRSFPSSQAGEATADVGLRPSAGLSWVGLTPAGGPATPCVACGAPSRPSRSSQHGTTRGWRGSSPRPSVGRSQ